MSRVIPLLTAAALCTAGCAPPPHDATSVAAEAAPAPAASSPASAHLVLASAVQADAPPAKSPPPDEAHASEGLGRTMGWFTLSLGVGAGLVAIGTSFMMMHQASLRAENCSSANVCNSAGIDANSQLQSLGGWNTVTWTAAVVGVGVGTILVLTNPATPSERQTTVGVAPSSSGAALLLRSTF